MAIGKKTIFIMLPLNLCLWGYIGYKFYTAFTDDGANLPINSPIAALHIKEDTAVYYLQANYPDPFLKDEPIKRLPLKNYNVSTNKSSLQTVVKKTPTISTVPIKDIKYLGLIQNKTSGTTTALISINGTSYIVKKGEVIDGVSFESITNEAIIARIGKEKLMINKS